MKVPGIVKSGLILWLAGALLLTASPAAAQNPPVAACGLPAGGAISASVTYTLSASCTQTSILSTTAADIEVTINGGGHSITSSGDVLFSVGSGVLTLNDVTLNGGGLEFSQLVQAARLDATRASFINLGRGTALAAAQMNLNNVYLAFNNLVAWTYGGNGTAILGRNGDVLSLHNVVVHNNFGSGGAIVLREGSALTTTGCLTLSGNMPYNVFDPFNEWTDESTGTCSGAIGNGHAVPQPPSLMTCGLPGPGNLDVSATYQLYADCTLTGRINISEGVEVRVVGNGRVLRSSPTRFDIFLAANSRLRLENIRLDGVRVFSWGELDARQIRVINGRNAILFNMGSASFDNALFEDNVATSAASRSVLLAWNAY